MSFTSEVKDELARVVPACPQCEKATLAALVRIEGTLFVSGPARYRVEIATDAPASARLVVRLLHGIYSLKTNLTMRRSVLHKTPNYLIEVPAQPHLADALRDMGVLSAEGGLEMGIKESLVAKPCCAAPFWAAALSRTPKATFTLKSPWNPRRWPRDSWSSWPARTSRPASWHGAARTWST